MDLLLVKLNVFWMNIRHTLTVTFSKVWGDEELLLSRSILSVMFKF